MSVGMKLNWNANIKAIASQRLADQIAYVIAQMTDWHLLVQRHDASDSADGRNKKPDSD